MKWPEVKKHREISREVFDTAVSRWRTLSDAVAESERTGMHYIFTLNTGGLAGTLTLIAAREPSRPMAVAALSFAAGIILVLLRSTWAYYLAQHRRNRCTEIHSDFFAGKTTHEEMIKHEAVLFRGSRVLETLAWLSGLAVVVGIAAGGAAIWQSAQPSGGP